MSSGIHTPPLDSDRRWSASSRVPPSRSSTDNNDNDNSLPDEPLASLLPLSHSHPLLATSDPTRWNVDEFLLTRAHIPLEELRSELRDYLAKLKEELGELINDDYEEFISLGLGLRGEGERLKSLKGPLQELKGDVDEIHSSLSTSQNLIQNLLSERSQVRSQKELIHLLLHLTESLERTEKLLGLSGSSTASPSPEYGNEHGHENSIRSGARRFLEDVETADLDLEDQDLHHDLLTAADIDPYHLTPDVRPSSLTRVEETPKTRLDIKTIARVANEYTQVTYLLEKAKFEGCEYVYDGASSGLGGKEGQGERIQERVKAIRTSLKDHLNDVFTSAITAYTSSESTRDSPDLKNRLEECLIVYDIVKEWSSAEEVIRTHVAENLRKLISAQSLLVSPSPAVPQTPSGIPASTNNPVVSTKTPFTPLTAAPDSSNLFEHTLSARTTSSDIDYLDETISPLAKIYNDVLTFVQRDCGVFLGIPERLNAQHVTKKATDEEENQGFNILSNVIWEEIAKRVMDEIGSSVFAAGRVGELHQNYTLTQAFLTRLESLAPSLHAVESMRATATYNKFDKRWQLPVYFQLRWKEIVTEFEEALNGSIGVARGKDGFVMPQTAAAHTAIQTCWSPGVYIPELSGRFWRLTLQILSRYRSWLEKSAPALFDPEQQPDIKTQAAPSTRSSLNINRAPMPVSGPSLPTGDPSNDPAAAAAEETVLRISTLIAVDLRRFKRDMQHFWDAELSQVLLASLAEEEVDEMTNTFNHVLESLDKLMKSPDSHILSILSRRCAESLKLIRSVASQLRSSTTNTSAKTGPPAPSHFVSAIIKPVKDFFGPAGLGDGLQADVGEQWSRMIFEEVVSGYAAILSSVRKTEDLLRRHRKGKKTTFSLFGSGSSNASAGSSVEEEERFKTQMLTDIEALGRDARTLGIDVDEMSGWTALKEVASSPSE